jgi:predicted dinucleotide-utilizing enzyme
MILECCNRSRDREKPEKNRDEKPGQTTTIFLPEIWADPDVERNMHAIEVDAESVRSSMSIENIPSAENPRTGRITGLSVVALVRRLGAPLAVGS